MYGSVRKEKEGGERRGWGEECGINGVHGWRRGGREDRYGSVRREKEGGERRGMR